MYRYRAWAFYYIRPKAQLFHLCSKAWAQLKPNLFSKFFKPKKAQAWSMKPEPNPSPKNQARPTYKHPCRSFYTFFVKIWVLLVDMFANNLVTTSILKFNIFLWYYILTLVELLQQKLLFNMISNTLLKNSWNIYLVLIFFATK
jgi:hypothetical protein